MENTYACSYVEVLEILKHIPKTEYEKIPKEKIEFYENNKSKTYSFEYKGTNTKTMKETDAVIINLYKNYIATPEEKAKVEDILKLNTRKKELEKSRTYSSNVTFNGKNITETVENENVETVKETRMIVENKKPWYKKIWNKLINMFN